MSRPFCPANGGFVRNRRFASLFVIAERARLWEPSGETCGSVMPRLTRGQQLSGKTGVRASGLLDRVTASLKAAGVVWIELGGGKPNPRLSLVHEGVELCKLRRADPPPLKLVSAGGTVNRTGETPATDRTR